MVAKVFVTWWAWLHEETHFLHTHIYIYIGKKSKNLMWIIMRIKKIADNCNVIWIRIARAKIKIKKPILEFQYNVSR